MKKENLIFTGEYWYLILTSKKNKFMNINSFISIKQTGRKADFKELIGLTESGKTSDLLEFCTLMHPGKASIKEAQGSKCSVFPSSGEQYIYTIYTTAIVRTTVYKGTKIIYKL